MKPWHWLVLQAIGVLIVISIAIYLSKRPPTSASIYEGTALNGSAANFRLTDQSGRTITLTDFRGKVVVLAFMESQCREVCPLTAAYLRQANDALGKNAGTVVFIGINVNTQANAVADVAAATEKWHLNEITSWHFLTGSATELEAAWKAYDVLVQLPRREGEELLHTPGVYLIDQAGYKRWYISVPSNETGTVQWIAPLNELLVKHIQTFLN